MLLQHYANNQVFSIGITMQEYISTISKEQAMQTATTQSASTIIEALGDFFIDPTISNKVVAVLALQAHLAVIEARRNCA